MRVTCLILAAQFLASNDILVLEATAEVNRVCLNWVTNLGNKADYYILEKSDVNLGDFVPITTINTDKSNLSDYFTQYDDNIQEGDDIYRLKVRLRDGSLKITEYKTVNFKLGVDIRIFPNPASDTLFIDLNEYLGKDVEIYLCNLWGQQVRYQKYDKLTKPIAELDITN